MATRWAESRIVRFITKVLLASSRLQSNGLLTRKEESNDDDAIVLRL